MVLAAIGVLCSIGSVAAAAPGDVPVKTTTVSASEMAAATSTKSYRDGVSVSEPDQCKGIFSPVSGKNNGNRTDGGYTVSPATLELKNLKPDTDYAGCITITNYETDGGPIKGIIDDVDIVASNQPDASVRLIEDPTGVGTWIIPTERTFSVNPGEHRIIPYIVRTPGKLPSGTVVGGISARLSPIGGVRAVLAQRVYSSQPGGKRRPLQLFLVTANHVVRSGDVGKYHVTASVKNRSDYLETYDPSVRISILGRTVGRATTRAGSLLPNGTVRIALTDRDLPWIGIFHPKLTVKTRNGDVVQSLPWLIVLPPWPYVFALVIAILIPIFLGVRRWLNRDDWRQYLDENATEYEDEWADHV